MKSSSVIESNQETMKKSKTRKKPTSIYISSVLCIAIMFLFVLSPWFLRYENVKNTISSFLLPLKNNEYKSAYFSALGGMIGSFLAVMGAFILERWIDKRKEENEIRSRARIIYFDMKLFYEEVKVIAIQLPRIIGIQLQKEKLEQYNRYIKYASVHIDNNWIANVAQLGEYMDENDVKNIYLFYGAVEDIKEIIGRRDIGEIGALNAYMRMIGNINREDYFETDLYREIFIKLENVFRVKQSKKKS